jgi:glycosyltransferase involved in cell wall biosynthesis
MNEPLVSIVIPVFNVERYIRRTLDSALRQTYPRLELVAVDDGSSDGTARELEAAAALDSRIRLVRQQHLGVAAARNRGVAEACGDLIALLDGDDLWHPQKIELQVKRVLEKPEAGLVYCWSSYIDENNQTAISCRSPVTFEGDVLAAICFQHFIGNGSTPLIRRYCLEEVGGFDEGLRAAGIEGCEDLKLYIQVAERYDFTLVPKFLVGYRRRSGSLSTDYRRMLRSYQFVMREVKNRRPELPNHVFRWSLAQVKAHFAAQAAQSGNWRDALSLSMAALLADPLLLLSLPRCFPVLMRRPQAKIPFARADAERVLTRPESSILRKRDHVCSIKSREKTSPMPRIEAALRSRSTPEFRPTAHLTAR